MRSRAAALLLPALAAATPAEDEARRTVASRHGEIERCAVAADAKREAVPERARLTLTVRDHMVVAGALAGAGALATKCVTAAVAGWRMAAPDGDVTVETSLAPPSVQVVDATATAAPGPSRVLGKLHGIAAWMLEGSLAPHSHPDGEESWFVAGGEVEVRGLGAPVRLLAGSAVHVPRGRIHAITADGPSALVQFFSPDDAAAASEFNPESPAATRPAPPAQMRSGDAVRDSPGLIVRAEDPRPRFPLARRAGTARIVFEPANTQGSLLSLVDLHLTGRIAPHTHPGSTELLYVYKGSGAVEVGRRTYPLKRGSLVRIPPDVEHALRGPFDAVEGFTPAGPEARYGLQGTPGAVED